MQRLAMLSQHVIGDGGVEDGPHLRNLTDALEAVGDSYQTLELAVVTNIGDDGISCVIARSVSIRHGLTMGATGHCRQYQDNGGQ